MEEEVGSEEKKPRKKSLTLREPFYLSLIISLPQLILKSHFTERQTSDNI